MDSQLTDWLLEAKTPSIRYFTLTNLMDKPQTDSDVQAAWLAMAGSGPIPDILSRQTEAGHWEGERSYYTPKYHSTHWSMMLLTELGIDGANPQFQRGIDFMLADTERRVNPNQGDYSQGLLCFWGNLLRYVAQGKRLYDPRVQPVIDLIAHEAVERRWQCPHNSGLSCAWGVVRALWGLAAIPSGERSRDVQRLIDDGLAYLLDSHELATANYPADSAIHPMWHKLNFPLFYQGDILFVLRVIAELDGLDQRGVQLALDWLRSKQRKNGRWRGSSPYKSRTWRSLGDAEESSRWVSLHAAQILKAA